ncbi:MAG TPA: methylated-DNA--[protein]-cysteine S-methyltransferase [Steroidobacteraceae bacterium]|nr:methylated-DNA--[protein]-cysteine S-methyltransferase [Steroidobacteraceae bacterium]
MKIARKRPQRDASARSGRAHSRPLEWPEILQRACRIIETQAPSLEELAERVRVSRAELQRQFTRRLGVSPKAYGQTLALHRLAKGAAGSRNALDAVLDAGFGTTSSAYAAASKALGVAPGRLRRALGIGWWMGLSDLGWMLLGATDSGICWLTFGNEPGAMLEELRAAFPKAHLHNDEERLYSWFEAVRDFILLPREALDLPLDIQGTAFQSRVWRALRDIPLGETRSYREVAVRLGQPAAIRAVASACARNHLALLVPCHRVVGADGALAGYRWGIDRKRTLLEREGRIGEDAHATAQRSGALTGTHDETGRRR